MKKILFLVLFIALCACTTKNNTGYQNSTKYENSHVLNLSNNTAILDGKEVKEFDYVWNLDINDEDEYYTGQEPDKSLTTYISHDIIYYPQIEESLFSKQEYDGEIEWVAYHTSDNLKQYAFGTLPVTGENIPLEMMHTKEEAYNNPVIHINKAGTYILEGEWHGQVWINLSNSYEDNDENQKVTLVLNDVDIKCDVAPALVFYKVYEADSNWENKDIYTNVINLENAGAKIIIADNSTNNITGSNVYRLLKPTYKKENNTAQKKRYKYDSAVYSCQSLLIDGEEKGTGILNITSTTLEGLDSELHLTINNGNINIVSQDDGINVNEDDVSVFTMNGGRLTIFAAQGSEGDVIDSNGFIKINGGTILGCTPSMSDEILDSNNGTDVSENATIISCSSKNDFVPEMPQGENSMKPNEFEPRNFDDKNFDPNDFDPNNKPEPKEFPKQN